MEHQRYFVDGTRGETKVVSIRLPVRLIDEIDNYRVVHNTANRTQFIEEACKQRLSSLVCPSCLALNPENGKKCSVCGAELDTLKKEISDFERLYDDVDELRDEALRATTELLNRFKDLDKIVQKLNSQKEIRHIIAPNIKMQIDRLEKILERTTKVDNGKEEIINGKIVILHLNETELDILNTAYSIIYDPGAFSVIDDGVERYLNDKERLEYVRQYTPELQTLKDVYEADLDDVDWISDIYCDIYEQLLNYVKDGTEPASENTKP